MKKFLIRPIAALALVVGVASGTLALAATPTHAIDVFSGACGGSGGNTGGGTGTGGTNNGGNAGNAAPAAGGGSNSSLCGATTKDDAPTLVRNVINVLLYIIGILAVIAIIIGGIRYVTSNGDSSNTKAAKDTILYAVVGLIVAILAFSIVNFVVGRF